MKLYGLLITTSISIIKCKVGTFTAATAQIEFKRQWKDEWLK